MGLSKKIELENGITLNYHRIVSINKITNVSTIIEVASYINKEQRQKEIDYYNSPKEDKSMNVYIETYYIDKEYNETDNITKLYDYLKETEIFKDAEDM